MDAALLRERELFKKRALATPVVENTKRKERDTSQDEENARKKSKPAKTSTVVKTDASNYKTMTGSSQYKFGVLAKIVKFMKTRYQDGDDHPLTLDEILDETNQLDVGSKVKQWLLTEALASNPKIEVLPDARYQFKPPFKIRDKKGLLRLLKQHDLKGYGGIYLDDIQESLPHFEKAMKSIANEIITITRPIDKKKVIFYHDRAAALPVDDEFQKLWRAVAVDGIDDEKIQEYLEKQGIRSMQESNLKKTMNPAKRRKAAAKKKQFRKPRDNEHLADVLEVFVLFSCFG